MRARQKRKPTRNVKQFQSYTISSADDQARAAIGLSKQLKEVIYQFAKKHTKPDGTMIPEYAICITAALKTLQVNHWAIMLKNFKGSEVLAFMNKEAIEIAEQVLRRRAR